MCMTAESSDEVVLTMLEVLKHKSDQTPSKLFFILFTASFTTKLLILQECRQV